MLEQIRHIEGASAYDFRVHADLQDPLTHLFPLWLDYYRLKWSIASWLKPRSILEIGVRDGYSAITFLNACPAATYIGLVDSDGHDCSNSRAIDWAREITSPYDASFVAENLSGLRSLPEGQYDLTQVAGALIDDSVYEHLEAALEVSQYVLLDAVFRDDANAMAGSVFLKDHQSSIEFATYLPGQDGALLIRPKQRQASKLGAAHSSLIQNEYDKSYYLEDCGGFDDFLATKGRVISDPRLNACVTLIDPGPDKTVLDVGCGRGEVAFACAARDAQVDAIDYSEAAIELSRQTIGQTRESDLIDLHCTDIAGFERSGALYDAIVAADFVEHVSPAELDDFYSWAQKNLSAAGELIIHTFPNLWLYQYEYARKRRVVMREGGYLSPNPRTDYEKQMHINEQSPRILYRQLKANFDHVLVWLATDRNPVFSLQNELSHREASTCPSIFAVASNVKISRKDIERKFSQGAIDAALLNNLRVQPRVSQLEAAAGEICVIEVSVTNSTGVALASQPPYPVHLSYHLRNGDRQLVFDGDRSKLNGEIRDGETVTAHMKIRAPSQAGRYQVDLTAVQEHIAWVEQPDTAGEATVELNVS